jgi:hypothetical protein
MKIKKIIASIMCAALLAANAAPVAASASAVIDFSANDFVMRGIGGGGEMDYIDDGGRRVIRIEVVDGFDPEADEPGSTKGDPHGEIDDFESLELDGDRYKYMAASIKNESAAPYFEIHFSSPSSGYAVATSVNFGIDPNSDYTKYIWNVEEWYERYYPKRDADHPQGGTSEPFFNHWSGHINNLRLDYMYYTEPGGQARTGDKIYIEYIAFFETREAAEAWEFTPARTPASIEEARLAAQAERDAAAAEAAAQETEAGNNDAPASDNEDGGGPLVIIIIIGVVVVAAIVIIAVITSKKKKAD